MDIRNEIVFWTLIMREHGEFQYTSLAPSETAEINQTAYFMNLFERLNSEAKSINNESSFISLINECKTAVLQFINFKRYMLANLMTCNLKLRMTPSLLNHMINEALEFKYVLDLADGTIPYNNVLENLRIHKVWLPDASGHANTVSADLDAIEKTFVKEAEDFAAKFDSLFKKSFEMYTLYERTGLENGALNYLNDEVVNTLTEFNMFLEKVESLRSKCILFSSGTFSPLIPNHMMREEDYYIYKINELSKKFS